MGAKNLIIIDAELQEIVPGFLEKRRQEIPLLSEALTNQNFSFLQSIGHKLKGNSGGYGFDQLSQFGANLEEAAKKENKIQCEALIESIKDYISNIEIQFKVLSE